MGVGVGALATSALGLQLPWMMADVKPNSAKRHIDSEMSCRGAALRGQATLAAYRVLCRPGSQPGALCRRAGRGP